MSGNPIIEHLAIYVTTMRLRVFPLHDVVTGKCSCGDASCGKNAGKHPRIKDWQRESSNSFDKVFHQWWRRWPHANIGVPAGLNGLLVIDVDQPAVWEALIKEHGNIPETFQYVTGGNGRHLWFRHPKDAKLSNRTGGLPYGIDVRGDGGYVVAPPSRTLKGSYHFVQSTPSG